MSSPESFHFAMEIKHICFLLILISHFHLCFSGEINSLESVPDLEQSMYLTVNGYPCVRLLNLSGEIGCANPGREKVVAPVVRLKNIDKLTRPSAVLVSKDEMQNLFNRVLNDQKFAKKVAGVFVESTSEVSREESGFSPVEKFPQSKFAPYKNSGYEWNPMGSNIMWNKYNFPVFLLSPDSTLVLQEIADKNEQGKRAYTFDVTEFDLVMQTTKAGTHDSESCLKQQSCLPLGGYSDVLSFWRVWKPLSVVLLSGLESLNLLEVLQTLLWLQQSLQRHSKLRRINVLSSISPLGIKSEQPKPILLVVTSMDSASFFRDFSPGADSPLSGMISLLAAVDALSDIEGLDELKKQLVFLVFTGEAWDYLGSRRFLAELDTNSELLHSLNSTLIEQVLEVGSIGKAFGHGLDSFFIHATGESSDSNKTLEAFQYAQESLGSSIKISMASKSNPGIPPSSLMSFLTKNSSISGFVLEDFDTTFTNKFYHSHLDDLSNINSSSIVTSASLIARTLYILASDENTSNKKQLNSITVNSSLVDELLKCLLTCDPGMSCELVKDYITPTSSCANNYVGVLIGAPSLTPDLEYVSDISRFVWNFLAERTSRKKTTSPCSKDGCGEDGVCIRSEIQGKGICVTSTTRYIPAYSTRLKFESGGWKVIPANASDEMGMVDPVWTESFWDTIQVRVYTVQDAKYDRFILFAGIFVTVLAYFGVVITRAVVTKALKRD